MPDPQIPKLQYTKRGVLLGAEFGTVAGGQTYAIRIEATDRAAALLFAIGVEFRFVDPSEDSGRPWYQFPYSPELAESLQELADAIGDVIYNQPTFGQMTLFDEAGDA